MESRDVVDWERIGQPDFDRIVELLLFRHYEDQPLQAQAVDGRGGDGGMDVVVKDRNGKAVHVYQLKYFPEGFSGGYAKSRQGQIRRSFTKAAEMQGLKDWTLVVPRNLTPGEEKFVYGLRGDRSIKLHLMGRAQLDRLLAKYPDINAFATRDELVRVLHAAAHEKDALASGRDLFDRALNLAVLADSRSPYWGVRTTMDPRGVVHQLYPKRPDAHLHEPISITFTTRFGPEHEELRLEYEKSQRYGLMKPMSLPPEVIDQLQVVGPEWMQPESDDLVGVELHPRDFDGPKRIDIQAMSEEGSSLSALRGWIQRIGAGTEGGTFEATFKDCLTMTFFIRKDDTGGSFQVSYDVNDVPATDAYAVLRFCRDLRVGRVIAFSIDGTGRYEARMPRSSFGQDEFITDPTFMGLVEDLALIERELGVIIPVPVSTTVGDAKVIRAVRMVLEGRCTVMPRVQGLNGTLDGSIDDEFRRTLTEGAAIHAVMENFGIEVLGQRLQLGTLHAYHPRTIVKGATEHLIALDAGQGKGRRIDIESADGTPFRVWLQERWMDPNKPIIPEPWGLPEVDEHDGLPKLLSGD